MRYEPSRGIRSGCRHGILSVILLMLFVLVQVSFATSRQSYTDINGQGGLVITAFKTSQCTGTPPSVTPNGGATQFVFSHLGSGIYQNDNIQEGMYYIFEGAGFGTYKGVTYIGSDSALAQINTMQQDGWVTSVRLATGAVTTEKLANGSVTNEKLGASAVTGDKIATGAITNTKYAGGSITRDKMSTAFTGSGFDDSYQLDEMQKWQRAGLGAWDSTTGYDQGQLDSLMKKLVLNLAYSSPAITLTLTQGEGLFGLDALWDQSGGSAAHNDSATMEYQLWVGTAAPPITLPGTLDASEQSTLASSMRLYETVSRPSYNGMRRFISFTGTLYVMVVGIDWQGTQYGSGVVVGTASNGDIGSIAALNGGFKYANQPLTNYVKDIANTMEGLTIQATSQAKPKIVFSQSAVAGYADDNVVVDTLNCWREADGVAEVKVSFAFRIDGVYNTLRFYGEAWHTGASKSGSFLLDCQGEGSPVVVNFSATPNTPQEVTGTCNVGALPNGSYVGTFTLADGSASGADEVLIHNLTIELFAQ